MKDEMELMAWVRRHQSRSQMVQFKPNPRAPDGSVNEQKFHAVHKFMADRRIVRILRDVSFLNYSPSLQYAYAGWHLPSGKFSYNMFIFPMGTSFAGAVFSEGIPDLPGSGNILDVQPSADEMKTQPLRGLNIHPAILARIQGIEPAKRKQMFTQLREQMLRQQLQQTQQPHNASGQAPNSLGMSMPANMYGTVASVPAGLHVGNFEVVLEYCIDASNEDKCNWSCEHCII